VTPAAQDDIERRGRWIAAGLAVALVALWELVLRTGIAADTLLPAPTSIAAELWRSVQAGEMMVTTVITLRRVLLGLLFGGGVGLVAGWLMGASRRFRAVTDPFVAAMHPIPKLALLPLFMVLLEIGESAKIAVIAAASFFPMVLNSMAGVRTINVLHFDVARSYGASHWQMLRLVALPGSIPMVLTGVRLAANIAFLSAIAVEMVSASDGLGGQVWLSWQVLRMERLFATLVVIAALGLTLNQLLRWVAERAAPWLGERERTA
jgi:ABC-type nitrate/sulfonate/bicarbonate transport system permease component